MKKKIAIILTILSCLMLTSCQEVFPTDNYADMLPNTKWNAGRDDSQIHFFDDGTFKYYKEKDDLSDNYYEGTYSFYSGKDAINYITKDLAKYGVSEEEWFNLILRNKEYSEENSVCLVLHNETCIVGGKDTMTTPYITPYMGFYFENQNVFDITNMNTANYTTFTKVIE